MSYNPCRLPAVMPPPRVWIPLESAQMHPRNPLSNPLSERHEIAEVTNLIVPANAVDGRPESEVDECAVATPGRASNLVRRRWVRQIESPARRFLKRSSSSPSERLRLEIGAQQQNRPSDDATADLQKNGGTRLSLFDVASGGQTVTTRPHTCLRRQPIRGRCSDEALGVIRRVAAPTQIASAS